MNATKLTRAALVLVASIAGATLVAPRTAHAGIIILKNGKVFIGRIDAEDVTDENVVMRQPRLYKGAPAVRGEQKFPKYEIRWFDANSDEPTDEYMKLYEDAPIDQRYTPYVQRWKERRESQLTVAIPIIPTLKTGSLSAISTPAKWGVDEATIRKPTGWTLNKINDIYVFESDQKGTEGFVPRIHLFAVDAPIAQVSDVLTWIRSEIEKLSAADGFDLKAEGTQPKPVKGGYDCEWVTASRHRAKTIRALRKIYFRDHRTYFITCYAHEKDFEGLLILFRSCIGTLTINEGGSSTAATAAEQVDVSQVAVGQTYTFKSGAIPDAITWEITAKESATIRHRTTTTQADGSKKTTEQTEGTGPVDAVARMTAIAGAPASPAKVQTEKVTVSGQTFDCDVFEAAVNGKKYRLWLTKKFPVELKLTVDGAVERELAEIK